MFGQKQTKYPRKNWSSFMLMNCGHEAFLREREVVREEGAAELYFDWVTYANNAPGLDLHGFKWLRDEEIGQIRGDWNTLLTKMRWEGGLPPVKSELPHFTLGGPWHGLTGYFYSEAWADNFQKMLLGTNPCAMAGVSTTQKGVTFGGSFSAQETERPK
jgi:hypothetical protein